MPTGGDIGDAGPVHQSGRDESSRCQGGMVLPMASVSEAGLNVELVQTRPS
jgi:hypothetical protein